MSTLPMAAVRGLDDGNTWNSSSFITFSDEPHYFEVDWQAASAPTAPMEWPSADFGAYTAACSTPATRMAFASATSPMDVTPIPT